MTPRIRANDVCLCDHSAFHHMPSDGKTYGRCQELKPDGSPCTCPEFQHMYIQE